MSTPACLFQPSSGFLTHVRGKGETARHWAFHFINLDFFGLHEGKKNVIVSFLISFHTNLTYTWPQEGILVHLPVSVKFLNVGKQERHKARRKTFNLQK